MARQVAVIDQTVNEALRLGTERSDIELIVSTLQKYSVEAIDVSLCYWEKARVSLERLGLLHLLRCKVDSSNGELSHCRKIGGFTKVIIVWQHQPGQSQLAGLAAVLAEVRSFAKVVYLCIDNANQCSITELQSYWPLLVQYEVKRVIYHDQDSSSQPFQLFETVKVLQQTVPCPIEFHGHNAYGLATANNLAAIRAHVRYVATAVGGIGGCGHGAMEEVLMAVKHLWKWQQGATGQVIAPDCARILACMGLTVPVDKAIIGPNVFAHESGIHVDGIAKNPLLYEVIQPEAVGLHRQVIIGKHSGTASLKYKFTQWNLDLTQMEAIQVLKKTKQLALKQKGPLSDQQLRQILRSCRN
jgi:homocitrate synthase NifV